MTERSPSPTITLESPRQALQLLLVVPKVWYTSLPGMAIGHRAACHRASAVYTRHIPGASLIIEFSPMAADAPPILPAPYAVLSNHWPLCTPRHGRLLTLQDTLLQPQGCDASASRIPSSEA
jgi:hypothetical protein